MSQNEEKTDLGTTTPPIAVIAPGPINPPPVVFHGPLTFQQHLDRQMREACLQGDRDRMLFIDQIQAHWLMFDIFGGQYP